MTTYEAVTDPDAADGIPETNLLGNIESDERTWWDRNREAFSFQSSGAIYALTVLVLWFIIRSAWIGKPFYLSEINVANVLEQASLFGIMSIGMTVLLISGNFDLSVASNAAMSAMIMAMTMEAVGPLPAVLLGIAAGTAGGLFNGLVHHYVGLNSFIVTLGTMFAYRGVVLYVNDGNEKLLTREDATTKRHWAAEELPPTHILYFAAGGLAVAALIFYLRNMRRAAMGAAAGIVAALALSAVWSFELKLAYSVIYVAILLMATWFVLRFTVTGRRVYATGGNKDAARAAGVVIARYVVMPFVFVGFCAGIAGMIVLAKVGSVPPTVLETRELDVIAAAIIGGVALTGGVGNVLKTMVGALLLFVLRNGFNYTGTSPFLTEIFIGALVIASAAAYVLAGQRAAAQGRA